ncbi:kinase-like domain-containing protein [Gaertneriomyces semiglobifer]|nr:kinase-like domain-containing protein [Gaertneriomyces semiglobifer]
MHQPTTTTSNPNTQTSSEFSSHDGTLPDIPLQRTRSRSFPSYEDASSSTNDSRALIVRSLPLTADPQFSFQSNLPVDEGPMRLHTEPLTALIPHSPYEVVLHHPPERRAVLFNKRERKLLVKRLSGDLVRQDERGRNEFGSGACAMCGRPFGKESGANGTGVGGVEEAYMNRDYWRLLEDVRPTPRTILPSPATENAPPVILPSITVAEGEDTVEDERPNGQLPTPPPSDPLTPTSFNQGYYDRFFVEERKLGRGLRGSVFLVQHVLDNVPLGPYAIKAIPIGQSHTWLVRMLKEVHLLERLRHPNVIEYKHAWLEERRLTVFGPIVPCLFILMHLANAGNLEEYIYVQHEPGQKSLDDPNLELHERARLLREKKRQGLKFESLSEGAKEEHFGVNARYEGGIGVGDGGRKVRYLKEDDVWELFGDICEGLSHLHSNSVIHRDLKPPNLLLHRLPACSPSSTRLKVLISDFGECELQSPELTRERTGATGTLEFMPPELLIQSAEGKYIGTGGIESDMWSLGVVLWFLCFSGVMWTQVDDVDVLRKEIVEWDDTKLTFPECGKRISSELKNIISGLLRREKEARWTIEEVLSIVRRRRQRTEASKEDSSSSDEQKGMRPRRLSDQPPGPASNEKGHKRRQSLQFELSPGRPLEGRQDLPFDHSSSPQLARSRVGPIHLTHTSKPDVLRGVDMKLRRPNRHPHPASTHHHLAPKSMNGLGKVIQRRRSDPTTPKSLAIGSTQEEASQETVPKHVLAGFVDRTLMLWAVSFLVSCFVSSAYVPKSDQGFFSIFSASVAISSVQSWVEVSLWGRTSRLVKSFWDYRKWVFGILWGLLDAATISTMTTSSTFGVTTLMVALVTRWCAWTWNYYAGDQQLEAGTPKLNANKAKSGEHNSIAAPTSSL